MRLVGSKGVSEAGTVQADEDGAAAKPVGGASTAEGSAEVAGEGGAPSAVQRQVDKLKVREWGVMGRPMG